MLRLRRVLPLALALCALCAVRGQEQPPASGGIVGFFAPPPIDVGLIPSLSRSPDSVETRVRASVRTQALAAVDRVDSTGTHYIAGKVIVKFKAGTLQAVRASAMALASARSSTQPEYANFDVLTIDPNDDAEAAAKALAARPDVEYAQPAYRVHTEMVPNDTFYSRQWNLPDIDMERAWDVQPQAGSQITVAVLDTGVAYTNVTRNFTAVAFSEDARGNVYVPPISGMTRYPALGPLTLPFVMATELGPSSRFVSPRDFIWGGTVPTDLDGHGTHVSGTIGQLTNNNAGTAGVAFNVRLMPVKVIDTEWDDIFNCPNFATDDIVAQGIRYAADNGAKVINMSIGRTGPNAPVVEDALNYAVGKGAFVAIAAGNEYESGNPIETFAAIAARIQGVVAVGAIDRSHNRAYYSSTGTYVELSAPGGSFRGFSSEGGILQQTLALDQVETFFNSPSSFGPPRFDALGYWYFIGTSQATPHVTGVAAMVMQQGITSPAAVEAALKRFAIDPHSRSLRSGVRDDEFGYGEISARATLRGLGLAK